MKEANGLCLCDLMAEAQPFQLGGSTEESFSGGSRNIWEDPGRSGRPRKNPKTPEDPGRQRKNTGRRRKTGKNKKTTEDPEHGRICGRLRRHLYGTRGAAAGWEDEYSALLQELGFKRGLASG